MHNLSARVLVLARVQRLVQALLLGLSAAVLDPAIALGSEDLVKQAYFGNLHVRPSEPLNRSVDGSAGSAHRFASGEVTQRANGHIRRSDLPLDFYALIYPARQLGGAQPGGLEPLTTWRAVINSAEAAYESGKLTTFIGFEYSGIPPRSALLRQVIFQNGRVADHPYAPTTSTNPQDLWLWMDNLRAAGIESLAIPRDPNGSANRRSNPGDVREPRADADLRELWLRNEPLLEIGQVDALKTGLLPVNKEREPTYQPGLIGSTGPTNPAGLTGVWAAENSRPAIYAALRRRETFATSGSRIQVRMVAGFRFKQDLQGSDTLTPKAMRGGVAMGGELVRGRGPLMIHTVAKQDPESASLQRLQVVKGWLENGAVQEKIFDIACAGNAGANLNTHRCPHNQASVTGKTCQYTGIGSAELGATWADPEFARSQPAYYYVRVLENPTCRSTIGDAAAIDVASRQELAYTSPVWYRPDKK